MSGERLTLAATDDSVSAKLVRMLARLPDEGLDEFCVIGGLAVLCRVGDLYRATSDIDAVVDDDGASIAALRARPSAQPTTNGVLIDGTSIDVIEVQPIESAELLPDNPSDRLFVLSHRYAYDTAEVVAIDVVDPNNPSEVVASATPAMATAAGLVAMKLNSYQTRHGRGVVKQGSDAQDLLALLAHHDNEGAIARTLAISPFAMGELCAVAAQTILIDDAEITSSRVRRYAGGEIDVDQLRAAGERLVQGIETAGS